MNQDQLKRSAAEAALAYVETRLGNKSIVGIGTGSTANCFIDALARIRHKFDATVASSEASAARLRRHGIPVLDLNAVDEVTVYVDGADEVDPRRRLIKGGGGALTREKIVAASADEFVCIVDESKLVQTLGAYPLPVEVIPMARGLVARALRRLGGHPELRQDFVTDNGNLILDVHGLSITDPDGLEQTLNNLVGAVCNGIFAAQAPTRVFVAAAAGVRELRP
ncbi:MAG: ribose-5-phosphate isomerase RpiA [Pseudomonadales bacterium]